MTKAKSGEPLDLDDGPAKGCDLFLVDGNNLAYRAYFALPEELATSDGQPTNALLGFANMLFKLLVDYQPRAVAVAWDTRPVERLAAHAAYKADRKPMPELLREQFPHFAPLVESFGYRNLTFSGWEADDVIATLATRADGVGLKTCVVSTDRDAMQLLTANVCLMMTPRGVSDVQVYTPERVVQRYGVTPAQIPDFIGLKGDTSDNIAGVPGIGDKTAAQHRSTATSRTWSRRARTAPRCGRSSVASSSRRCSSASMSSTPRSRRPRRVATSRSSRGAPRCPRIWPGGSRASRPRRAATRSRAMGRWSAGGGRTRSRGGSRGAR
ncbi:MAG: hypothetical protein IPG04_23680 [Polyangiaceae bacterium]|nr:hypothetical protein [Polyangiaceae bacterium]